MKKKKAIIFILIMGFLFVWMAFLFVTYSPDSVLGDNTLISEEMEPPDNLSINLDRAHLHIVRIEIQHNASNYDIEFEVKLDNEIFERIKFYQSTEENIEGDAIAQSIVPIDEGSTGKFEIIVTKSVGIRSVEYKIYKDPSNFYMFFYYDLGKFLPLGFVILVLGSICYVYLQGDNKH